mmetsp:Transcript_62407/g.182383  ORF Transcript_62407/g.182383 Transcript_62407/m.182383 type:complete len:95 (-) Transcript_62407:17-301(-)
MYSFLLGPKHPGLHELVDAAQSANKARWTDAQAESLDPGHFTARNQKAEAFRTIAEDSNPVWGLVRLARQGFGYRRLESGEWRYPQQYCKGGGS